MEEQTEQLDILNAEQPKEEVKQEEPVQEESQEKLDWRNDLPDELKTSETLLKFKDVEGLAQSYVRLEKKIGEKSLATVLDDKATYDEKLQFSEEVFKLKEDKYKNSGLSDQEAKLAWDNRVPPAQASAFLKDVVEFNKKEKDVKNTQKQDSYKEEIKKQFPDESVLNVRVSAGLKALGMTFNDYKDTVKDEAFNPKLIKAIAELGKSQYSEKVLEIKEGKPAGLPSDPAVLRAKINKLSKVRVNLKVGTRDRLLADKELEEVKAKLNEAMATPARSQFS